MACNHSATSHPFPGFEKLFKVKETANTMRQEVISMISEAKSGHPGGSLSAADIVATLFFSDIMDYNREDPNDHSQDRFFLSKGHAAPVLYAAFHQLGWIEDEDLHTLRRLGSKLQGHPDRHACPGIEICSGSLGQGLSVACGAALGMKLDAEAQGTKSHKVYAYMGDGEMQEGSNWEAIMFAAHQNLNNLIGIIDKNNLQIDGNVNDVCTLGDIDAKCEAFGWKTIHADGHCIKSIYDALTEAKAYEDGPVMVIFDTVKGKGVSFMENNAGWHGKAPNAEQTEQALNELKEAAKVFKKETCND